MTQLLASVRNLSEARIALEEPIGILDLKEPAAGALGAVTTDDIDAIIKQANGKCAVSATVGDLPPDADSISNALEQWSGYGLDYIKVGFFSADYLENYPAVLSKYAERINLVAVLFADRTPHLEGPMRLLAQTGCTGIMLDTADKNNSSVTKLLTKQELTTFVDTARRLSLLSGIAGSLRQEDIPLLAKMNPDYLGFRTALCENQQRNGSVSRSALRALIETLMMTSDGMETRPQNTFA